MTQVSAKVPSLRSPQLWMTGALFAFCAVALSMRGISARFDPFESNLFRSAGGLACILSFMLATGDRPRAGSWDNVRTHLVRNSFHWVGTLLWVASVATLPLATVFSLEFTTPIWVAVFAAAFLGRRIPGASVVGLLLGFLGVMIVVAPSPSSIDRHALLPLGTAVFFAIAILMTKALTKRNKAINVVFWMMAVQTCLNLASVAWNTGLGHTLGKLAEGGDELWLLPAIILGGLASQFCLTKALETGNEVVVMTLDFLRLPLIAALGYALYGEEVGLHTILGGGAILVAVALVTLAGKPIVPVMEPETAAPDTCRV